VTAADVPEIPAEEAFVGEGPMNFRDLSRNVMARDKVHEHPFLGLNPRRSKDGVVGFV
jgi:hypothetical protein